MAKQREHEQALAFRKQGLSIGDIAGKLNVSKSTVSMWCKDITLSSAHIKKIAKRSRHHATEALLRAAEERRIERQHRIAMAMLSGARDVGSLRARDIYMLGLGLYWGEGYKRGNQELGFTNSDTDMIRFYIWWLRECFGIERTQLILRVSINVTHAKRINEVEHYWAVTTGCSRSQFTKSSLITTVSKKMYTNSTTHFGTLRIKVRRGTVLRHRILGSLEAIKRSIK